MTDEGAYNLLIAITERAYKDYSIGLRILQSGYSTKAHSTAYMLNEFESARKFLEGTRIGNYLIEKARKEMSDD